MLPGGLKRRGWDIPSKAPLRGAFWRRGSSRADSGGGWQRLGRSSRDGAALLYGGLRRRGFSRGRPDCRQQRQSLWHDRCWRHGERRGVQALAGRDRDGALFLYGQQRRGESLASLIADSIIGNLYGTTSIGGTAGRPRLPRRVLSPPRRDSCARRKRDLSPFAAVAVR